MRQMIRRAAVSASVAAAVMVTVLAPSALRAEEAGGYQTAVKVTPLLKTTTTTSGAAIRYPSFDDPEVTAVLVEIPAGGETGWHIHPVPAYAYVIDGAIEVEMRGGAKRRFSAGEALAEMVDTEHNGRNPGPGPVTILMFATGEKGRPFSQKAE
ncbi:cupin domain-containing protein [Prosthecomicrobium pneumaticum]|uniref:Quercetin dioxygenase-like cupin family protein n=1 Tax=Prosthecomicrobium pneumaticum TaxID=81895 RepID=A0A7W9L368_9HYPH|nr:cupin domain-containing protein [Prosthecomicrobium pneumaticum]MBB5754253.1 quercetin dioxygenase-like cupin family protein [Prosthecomicrobium pneumaticum]